MHLQRISHQGVFGGVFDDEEIGWIGRRYELCQNAVCELTGKIGIRDGR